MHEYILNDVAQVYSRKSDELEMINVMSVVNNGMEKENMFQIIMSFQLYYVENVLKK